MKYRSMSVCLALFVSLSCAEQDAERQDAPLKNTSHTASAVVEKKSPKSAAEAKDPLNVQAVLNTYCMDCHGQDNQKGKVRFDTLATLDVETRTDLLSRANEAVHFEEMPPSNKPQPSEAERRLLSDWLGKQLGESGDAALKDKMRYPHYGNVIEHDLLFSGQIKDKAYTPSRRWLVSPQIYHERVMDVLSVQGRERENYKARNFFGVTNPFILPESSGVRDYDITALNGGHLLVMLGNTQWIVDKQIFAARLKTPEKDALLKNMSKADRWYPRQTPAAFEAIILADAAPTQAQMDDAVKTQFALALGRQPSEQELRKYVGLLSSSIAMAGNTQGLRQMLTAVLLESEFVYRMELGGGKPDAFGRKMLTPHEAAYAISYAIGDRKPDAELLKAAAQGRLETKADYQREVVRLLKEPDYFRAQIDPTLNGGQYKSNVSSHPKIVRFFREFFGYRAAANVFKDPPRALGRYQNPSRGTVGSPGWLILEADLIVTHHVEKDQDVFENLLTSDKYFVYHQDSGEKGKAVIAEWRATWDKLKDTPWQTEPMKVLEENFEFIKQQKSLRITKLEDKRAASNLVTHMRFFSEYFPKGKTPYPRVPWSHGYYINHSIFYSLPPTPMRGRYYSKAESPEYWANVQENNPVEWWDFPLEQPFSIPNRKGILSHPAWLIAHSQNFHTDPIRRGRWIREKLLAGRVPDVPITVDAQVPDHPDKTFRHRVEEVTGAEECWKCHKHMNPVGLPFEAYDDFGRYRTEEELEHPDNLIKRGNGKSSFDEYPTLPVKTTGGLDGTGDPTLDGDVQDPFELIDRLAKSDRVRQSIIRHAFRFYMGRNEMLSDAKTLIDADKAYVESGGSFKAVVVSLLTSDSFMYRKDIESAGQ